MAEHVEIKDHRSTYICKGPAVPVMDENSETVEFSPLIKIKPLEIKEHKTEYPNSLHKYVATTFIPKEVARGLFDLPVKQDIRIEIEGRKERQGRYPWEYANTYNETRIEAKDLDKDYANILTSLKVDRNDLSDKQRTLVHNLFASVHGAMKSAMTAFKAQFKQEQAARLQAKKVPHQVKKHHN